MLEIKCPYKYRHFKLEQVDDSSFYLLKTSSGLKLSPHHEYFYQVQMQLAICELDYCDFIVWTLQGIVVIRINIYLQFFEKLKPKLDMFFIKCILPKILVPISAPAPAATNSGDAELFCYCQQSEDGRPMIGCDNPYCPFLWFHFDCVGLSEEPFTDTWYCPDCSIHFTSEH